MIAVSGLRADDASQPQSLFRHRAFHHIGGLLLPVVLAVVCDYGRARQVSRVVGGVVEMKKFLLPPRRGVLSREVEPEKLRRLAEACARRNRGPESGVMRPELPRGRAAHAEA